MDAWVSRTVDVAGTSMHYLDAGAGRPVLFLHGNPTSSFLWRGVLPAITGVRLVAVDLVGMGGSGKPDIGYRLTDHVGYVTGFLDALALTGVTVVAHDWGVAIALECLRRRPSRIDAIAFMEGHVRPVTSGLDEIFTQLRTPGVGERLALEENFLIETLLPAGVSGTLTPQELDVYRRPYPDPASRRPLLQWTREIPVGGEPADVARLLEDGWAHLAAAPVRKLLVHGSPGAIIDAAAVDWCRRTQPGLDVADVGRAGHFLPEDRPAELAAALSEWIAQRSAMST